MREVKKLYSLFKLSIKDILSKYGDVKPTKESYDNFRNKATIKKKVQSSYIKKQKTNIVQQKQQSSTAPTQKEDGNITAPKLHTPSSQEAKKVVNIEQGITAQSYQGNITNTDLE